jgi:SAM-dependent methyltransferase
VDGFPQPDRFHAGRPKDLRGKQPPWHRLAYIVEKLPERLEVLSRQLQLPEHGTIVDFGSADAPYRHFFAGDANFLAADLPGNPQATVEIKPDGRLPLDDNSVDAVLSTQVLEHVGDPGAYLDESFRVLRPGGRMLLSTHGFMVWHPDPVDYWRWTCSGLQEAVTRAGFRVVHFEGIMGVAASGLHLIQDSY